MHTLEIKSRNHSKPQEMPAGGEGEVTGVKNGYHSSAIALLRLLRVAAETMNYN